MSRSTPSRVRLIRAMIIIMVIALAGAGAALFAIQKARTADSVDAHLRDQIAIVDSLGKPHGVRVLSSDAPEPSTPPEKREFASVSDYLYELVARRAPGENATSLAIVGGVATYEPDSVDSFTLADDPEFVDKVVASVIAENEAVTGSHDTDEGTARYIAVPVQLEGSSDVGIYVYAINLSAELEPLTAGIILYVLAALLGVCLMGIAAWFIIGRFPTALRELQETADQISVGELKSRVPLDGSDEMKDVGKSVNEMLDRIEGSVDAQRQLLDDVRHELKTPITIVRGYLEMMDVRDPEDVESAREIGISELDRMTRLVEDIDTLATVEGDEYTMGIIDISRLTERIGELVTVIPGHPWHVTRVADGIIRGNADRVLQAWLALSDNAAKYTPYGSPIEIGSSKTLDTMMMWVRDHGPGIPPAARHRIFRRFDRGAGKREVGGSGLGLAIVDAIARAHGGSCSVSETPGGGATFTIHIPLRLGSGETSLPAPVRAGDVLQQWEGQEWPTS